MDAHSVSHSSRSRRKTSRIYQDLQTILQYRNLKALPARTATTVEVPDESGGMARMQRAVDAVHIGIIGAGLAGLRCADVLLQHGFQVSVLESRQRVGGRLHQSRLKNGHLVDTGPNWIHGTDNNPILDLAKQTDTMVDSWTTRSYLYDQHGERMPLKESEDYSTKTWNIIEDAFKYSNKHSSEISADESLYDFFRQRSHIVIPDESGNAEARREILMQTAELWGAFVGSPIQRQSLRFCWLEECLEGENLFCAGTYKRILETIAKPAVDSGSIHYGKAVSRVHMKSEGETSIKVVTQGGETMHFDEVVCTAPLGWLKRHPDVFDPPLPSHVREAVDNIGYGCLEKVYISFPKAFWIRDSAGCGVTFDFYQWLKPGYAPRSNPQRWTQEAVDLASMPSSAAHPTLLFYIYGEQSRFLVDQVANLRSKDKDTYLFEWFRPYYSRLLHYDETSPDCQPSGCFATDFLNDEFAGNGSYTNFQVGVENGDRDIRALRQGVPQRGLWLAGEHTAPFVALGTATGAYWSGELVGKRIAESYGFEGVDETVSQEMSNIS